MNHDQPPENHSQKTFMDQQYSNALAIINEQRIKIELLNEAVQKSRDALKPFLMTMHWGDCEAVTFETEDDIGEDPGGYLEECNCSIKGIHTAFNILNNILENPKNVNAG